MFILCFSHEKSHKNSGEKNYYVFNSHKGKKYKKKYLGKIMKKERKIFSFERIPSTGVKTFS